MDEKWYTDPKLLQAAYEEYGSLEKVSAELGSPSPSCLQKQWRALGLPKLPSGPKAKKQVNSAALQRLYDRISA